MCHLLLLCDVDLAPSNSHYAHGFCGSKIWTGYGGDGFSQLHNIWGLSQKDLNAESDSTTGELKALTLTWCAGMTQQLGGRLECLCVGPQYDLASS